MNSSISKLLLLFSVAKALLSGARIASGDPYRSLERENEINQKVDEAVHRGEVDPKSIGMYREIAKKAAQGHPASLDALYPTILDDKTYNYLHKETLAPAHTVITEIEPGKISKRVVPRIVTGLLHPGHIIRNDMHPYEHHHHDHSHLAVTKHEVTPELVKELKRKSKNGDLNARELLKKISMAETQPGQPPLRPDIEKAKEDAKDALLEQGIPTPKAAEEERKVNALPAAVQIPVKEMRRQVKLFLESKPKEELKRLKQAAIRGVPGAVEAHEELTKKMVLAKRIMEGIYPTSETFQLNFLVTDPIRRMMVDVHSGLVDPKVAKAVISQVEAEKIANDVKKGIIQREEEKKFFKKRAADAGKIAYARAIQNNMEKPLAKANEKIAQFYQEQLDKMMYIAGLPEYKAKEMALKGAMKYKKYLLEPKKKKKTPKKEKGMKAEKFSSLARMTKQMRENKKKEEERKKREWARMMVKAATKKAKEINDKMMNLDKVKRKQAERLQKEEEQAAYADYQKVNDAATKARENVLIHGGTPEEAEEAAGEAEVLMKNLIKEEKAKKANEAEHALRKQMDPKTARLVAEHLATAHRDKPEDTDEDEDVTSKIVGVVPGDATRVDLTNAKIKLPVEQVPNVIATTKEEEEAIRKQNEQRGLLRGTFATEYHPVGLPVAQLKDGKFFYMPEGTEKLEIKEGKIFFSPERVEEMKRDGKDVSWLVPKMVTKGENPVGTGSMYYEGTISNMKMKVPTLLHPNVPTTLYNEKESLDISGAHNMFIKKGAVKMMPMKKLANLIRPEPNERVGDPEDSVSDGDVMNYLEEEKKDASYVKIVPGTPGKPIVIVEPNYGSPKLMGMETAIEEFSQEKKQVPRISKKKDPAMEDVVGGEEAINRFLEETRQIAAKHPNLTVQNNPFTREDLESVMKTTGYPKDVMASLAPYARMTEMTVEELTTSLRRLPPSVYDEAKKYYNKLADDPDKITSNLVTLGEEKFYKQLKQHFPNANMHGLLYVLFETLKKDTGKPNVAFDRLLLKMPFTSPVPVRSGSADARPRMVSPAEANMIINRPTFGGVPAYHQHPVFPHVPMMTGFGPQHHQHYGPWINPHGYHPGFMNRRPMVVSH